MAGSLRFVKLSKKLLADGFREQFQLLSDGHPAVFLDAQAFVRSATAA